MALRGGLLCLIGFLHTDQFLSHFRQPASGRQGLTSIQYFFLLLLFQLGFHPGVPCKGLRQRYSVCLFTTKLKSRISSTNLDHSLGSNFGGIEKTLWVDLYGFLVALQIRWKK